MSNFSFSPSHIFQFRFWPHRRNWQVILCQHATFHRYRITHVGSRYDVLSISKMVAAVAQFYFRIGLGDVTFFRRSMSISIPYRQNNSIHGPDVSISVLQKQTSAILEFYFRFRYQPLRRNLHVFLHQAIEFRPSRSTRCENMTSYPSLKMAAATDKYYFRFRICWCQSQPSKGQSLSANQISSVEI